MLRREKGDELWFPSLTNMMLAIAESLETVGTIFPLCDVNSDDEDYGTDRYEEKMREQCKTVEVIAKKYGSPTGEIVTN